MLLVELQPLLRRQPRHARLFVILETAPSISSTGKLAITFTNARLPWARQLATTVWGGDGRLDIFRDSTVRRRGGVPMDPHLGAPAESNSMTHSSSFGEFGATNSTTLGRGSFRRRRPEPDTCFFSPHNPTAGHAQRYTDRVALPVRLRMPTTLPAALIEADASRGTAETAAEGALALLESTCYLRPALRPSRISTLVGGKIAEQFLARASAQCS